MNYNCCHYILYTPTALYKCIGMSVLICSENKYLPSWLAWSIICKMRKTLYKRLPFPKQKSDDFIRLCYSSLKGILNKLVESEIERQRVNWFTWKETHLNSNLHHWSTQENPLWARKIFIPQAVLLLPNAISPKKKNPVKGIIFRGLDKNKRLTILFGILSCCYSKML